MTVDNLSMNVAPHISVVSPVYGRNLQLDELCQRLIRTLEEIGQPFEILLVNDASPDNSWERIVALSRSDPRIKGIKLSRNFGQHSAITAGLDHVRGEWVVVMDCDLQDLPEEIATLYAAIRPGIDMVRGRRANRTDSALNRLTSRLFYFIFRHVSGIAHDATIASFGIYSRRVIDAVLQYREQFRAFGILVHLVGFESASANVRHGHRAPSESSYTLFRRLDLAVNSIVAHSDKPLKLAIAIGIAVMAAAALYTIYLVIAFFVVGLPMTGFTTLAVLFVFLFGMNFLLTGLTGLYIGRVFHETKRRPLYHISNFTEDLREVQPHVLHAHQNERTDSR